MRHAQIEDHESDLTRVSPENVDKPIIAGGKIGQ
jgi:hypothetical protein